MSMGTWTAAGNRTFLELVYSVGAVVTDRGPYEELTEETRFGLVSLCQSSSSGSDRS